MDELVTGVRVTTLMGARFCVTGRDADVTVGFSLGVGLVEATPSRLATEFVGADFRVGADSASLPMAGRAKNTEATKLEMAFNGVGMIAADSGDVHREIALVSFVRKHFRRNLRFDKRTTNQLSDDHLGSLEFMHPWMNFPSASRTPGCS